MAHSIAGGLIILVPSIASETRDRRRNVSRIMKAGRLQSTFVILFGISLPISAEVHFVCHCVARDTAAKLGHFIFVDSRLA